MKKVEQPSPISPRRDQGGGGRRRGEQRRADDANHGAGEHGALRTVAVDGDADRDLRRREGEEEGARQQPDLRRRQSSSRARSLAMTPMELRRNWLTL